MSSIVEVFNRAGVPDAHGRAIAAGFKSAGVAGIRGVKVSVLYKLVGSLSPSHLETIAKELLIDKVTQQSRIYGKQNYSKGVNSDKGMSIEVWLKPGVTDPVGESVKKGIRDLGIDVVVETFSGTRYVCEGDINKKTIEQAVRKLLVNPLIHDYTIFR